MSKMSTRVYLGGLSHRARERDVEKFFRKFGRIRDISLKNGFAFVDFDDYRDADDACYELSGKDFLGERVTVELARGTPHGRDRERWGDGRRGGGGRDGGDRRGGGDRGDRDGRGRPVWLDKYGPPTRTNYRVTVENLSSRVSWQDLKDYMRQAGDVTYADAHKTRKNEGVVEFACKKDLQNAMDKLDGSELNGRRIKLVEESRARSRSRGSRSRSKSRSRSRKRSASRSRSKSRSPVTRRSRSPATRRTRSRSRSPVERRRTRSRSGSGKMDHRRSRSVDRKNGTSNKRSVSRSRSRTPVKRSRSRSASASKDRKAERNGDKSDHEAEKD